MPKIVELHDQGEGVINHLNSTTAGKVFFCTLDKPLVIGRIEKFAFQDGQIYPVPKWGQIYEHNDGKWGEAKTLDSKVQIYFSVGDLHKAVGDFTKQPTDNLPFSIIEQTEADDRGPSN